MGGLYTPALHGGSGIQGPTKNPVDLASALTTHCARLRPAFIAMDRVMHLRTLVMALTSVLIVACSPADKTASANAAPAGSPSSETPAVKDAPTVADSAPAQTLQPPRTDSVLYFISDVDGDGATSYEIANGAWINTWYGLQHAAGGKQYYTGFAWITPTKYGAARDNDEVDPDAKVTLAQATFEASAPGTESPWRFVGAEPAIGDFGAAEKGNSVDTKRKVQTWTGADGTLLVAVPTWYLSGGSHMRLFDLLATQKPTPDQDTQAPRWRYVGTVEAGEDNSAACGPDNGGLPCRDVSATLAFQERAGSALPDLKVSFTGNGAGSGDTAGEYRYDSSATTYRSTSR